MGTSTNAYITYGIDLGEECKYGFPWFNEDEEDQECGDDVNDLFDEWSNKVFGEGKSPYELVIHCSYDYPMYILTFKESSFYATRGCVEIFDPSKLLEEVDSTKIEKLKDFLTKYDIKDENGNSDTSWLLFSLWG
jgi:hypothetical protein